MAEGMNNLLGGVLTGFVGSKNKAREMALNEEYKKIAMENVKATAKLHEAQIKKADLEGNLLSWAMGGSDPGGMPEAQPTPTPTQPFAQFQPQTAPQATPQPLPDMMAAGQMPFLAGPVSGLAPDLTSRLAAMGQDFYNTTGQPLKITDGFRTTAQQADVYARKPNLAVPPGSSKHEKGLAVDVDTSQIPLLEQSGLLDKYGFTRPALAGKGETWHLELGPQPQQAQYAGQGLGTPQQAIQPRGGLTREKFLEGYMKKNFGVEPDEVTVSSYGDHKLITDKKKGTPLFIIAGQGKTEMVDATMPDGSVIKRPVVIPPSPIPGGIPVVNAAGQPASGVGLGGPMLVKPPEYTYEEIGSPGGGKRKVPIPKAQPGGPEIPTEPGGVKMTDLGYTNLMMQGMSKLDEVNKLLFPEGKLDRSLLLSANAPAPGGGGFGKGTMLYSKMYQTVEAALRLETKAAATPGEVQTKLNEYWPNLRDTEEVVREKIKDLNEYMDRVGKLYDPTGEVRKSGGVSDVQLKVPKGGLRQKPKTWDELKKGLTGGQ